MILLASDRTTADLYRPAYRTTASNATRARMHTTSPALAVAGRVFFLLRLHAQGARDLGAAAVIGGHHRQLDDFPRGEVALHRLELGIADALRTDHAVRIGEHRALAVIEQIALAPARQIVDLLGGEAAADRHHPMLLELILAAHVLRRPQDDQLAVGARHGGIVANRLRQRRRAALQLRRVGIDAVDVVRLD